ncbi:hypothetical protein JWZ98_06980 [Methylomonas sp. EFPC1]|uniref:hypothetical protein n=1 Tax=Methylomonas sp. EFPC1 TaxID=2812647 RepID=UPI00196859AD|nr:hypothetical protein [Methylomonas sp. EFPC1]QSB02673.1 hypothetical protein JWZ98_06980 [Methylomonas sp. EFPC1]
MIDIGTRKITGFSVGLPSSATATRDGSATAPVYYHYDPDTGEYLGIADSSTASNAQTLVAPPDFVSSGHVAVFDGTSWSIAEDNRGDVWDTTTGMRSQYSALGNLPGNLTKTPKPDGFYSWNGSVWAADYVAARAAKVGELKAANAAQITSGIYHNALGSVHRYPTTKDDQTFMNARFSKAKAFGVELEPYKFMCCNQSGEWARRDHTASQIIDVALGIDAHITDTLNHLDTRLAALSLVPDDLDAIADFSW